jgi:hypothetical protein
VSKTRKAPAIEGTCLCGAVQLAVARRPRKLTQCNCSVCRRYGTLWAYYRRREVTIKAPRGGLDVFSRRPRGLRFLRCKRCGCVTTWEQPRRGPEVRLGLNARLLDHQLIADLPVTVLDGDRTWRVLERYRRPAMFISPSHR